MREVLPKRGDVMVGIDTTNFGGNGRMAAAKSLKDTKTPTSFPVGVFAFSSCFTEDSTSRA
jgi:hypothetical protein